MRPSSSSFKLAASEGKDITPDSPKGHTFIVIAGLRLDTGYHGENEGTIGSTRSRPSQGYVARHLPGW